MDGSKYIRREPHCAERPAMDGRAGLPEADGVSPRMAATA